MINIDTLFGGRIPTIFGGDTGMTYEELQRRKKVAEALMGGGPQRITNVGEGIYSASRDIAGALLGKKLRKEENRQQDEANSAFDSAFGGGGFAPPAGGYGTPPAAGEAPASWDQIKNGIFAGESGGDYNALFGYSNRPGGQFQGVKLTDMTVDQALQFSDPSGPYAGWVKGQVGRVATPMGAYQVVGSTLRAAKQGLGLRGDERMTPELQDQIGQWIYKTQGTGAWAGYKGPRSGGGGGQQQQVSPAMLAQFAAQANNPALSPDRRAQAQAMYDAATAQYAQQLKPQEAPKRDTQYVDGVGLIDTQTGEVVQQYDTQPERDTQYVEGVGLIDKQTGEVIQQYGQGGEAAPDVKGELDLTKAYRGEDLVKEFNAQAQAYGRIVASAKDPSAAGDLAMIFNFMKLLDPGSVVRESEFATAENAAGVPDRVRNVWNKLKNGERLGEEQRADFVARANALYQQAERGYNSLTGEYTRRAEDYGYNPDRTIPDYRYRDSGAPLAPTQRPERRPKPEGAGIFTSAPSIEDVQTMSLPGILGILANEEVVKRIPDDVLNAMRERIARERNGG